MTNNERITQALVKFIGDNPRASVNACCRELTKQDIPVSKPLVASIRKNVIKGIVAGLKKVDGPPVDGGGYIKVDVRVKDSPRAMLAERAEAKLEEERREREAKRARDADRELAAESERAQREAAWARAHEETLKQASLNAPLPSAPFGLDSFVAGFTAPPAPLRQNLDALPPIETVRPAPVPHRRGDAASRAARRQFVNEVLDADPGADPISIIARMKERFGVGLDWRYVYDTCRVAREIHGLPQLSTNAPHERVSGERVPLPTFPGDPESAAGVTPEEDLNWLVRQLRDVMRAHGLASVEVVASETGANWQFTEKPRGPRSARGEVKF